MEEVIKLEEHEKLISDYVKAFNAGDMDGLCRIFSEDAEIHGALGWGGLNEIVPIWRMLHSTFNFQLAVEEILVQGENVVARFLERGTSIGAFRGQAPTGKTSEVIAIEWFVIQGGHIRRRWGVRDSASHFRQMGLSLG